MRHKIVAIRMDEHKGEVTLSGLTESPRGTKTRANSIKFTMPRGDRKERQKALAKAVAVILGRDE